MDREILFRGKRVDNDEWVEGYYAEFINYLDGNGKPGIQIVKQVPSSFDRMIPAFETELAEVIPETVGYFTGKELPHAKSYKKQKLFEGDVIGWSEDYDDKFGYPATAYGKGVIVWNSDNCCFGVKTGENNIQDFNDFDFDESCCILGNIHDNPELLEGK